MLLSSSRVKVKFTLEYAMKTQRGSRGIAVLFLLTLVLEMGQWLMPCPLYVQE
jgi:hypothetical protein